MHQILYTGGVSSPKRLPQGRHSVVFHFEAANTAATQFEIWHTNGDDATGCAPDNNWVKRKSSSCTCGGQSLPVGDFLASFSANGVIPTAAQYPATLGSQIIFDLANLPDAKYIRVIPVGAAAGVTVTLEML